MLRRPQVFCWLSVFFILSGWPPSPLSAQRRQVTDDVRVYRDLRSKFLPKGRDVIVWLPPGYESEPAKRYPVLYMQDGGDVFAVWRIDEIAKPLIASRQIEPLIIVMVAIAGTLDDRFNEYTPTSNSSGKGGKADSYGRMLVEELKPFIDSEYRTLSDAANTGLGGVSLGGLVSLYLALKYPTTFGRLSLMSPSVWWDNKLMVRNVKALASKPPMRIWLDVGTAEGPTAEVKDLRDALVKKGWVLKSDLMYFEASGGKHDQRSFMQRAEPMLKYLFPATTQN